MADNACSWTLIAKTSGRSEEAQRAVQRRTLAYQTIRAINDLPGSSSPLQTKHESVSTDDRSPDFPPNFILSPFTAAQPPLPAELAARFPDWSATDVDALMADHRNEIALLKRYIREADLEKRVKEVAELVRGDGEGGDEDGDVEM